MRKERLNAAGKIAETLFAAENAVDGALSGTGSLSIAMLSARSEIKLAATVGHAAVAEVAAATAALAQARGHLVEAHRILDVTKRQIGLDGWDFGTGGGKPEDEKGHLRVVERRAA